MSNLHFSPMFSNGMVLQRDAVFPLRGRSLPQAEVRLLCTKPGQEDQLYRTQADKNGKWRLDLDPVPAGGPYMFEIESMGEEVVITDVYYGDVWLCAGQSNMEMLMHRVQDNFPEEWEAEDYPPIHQFKVPQEWDFAGPRDEVSGGSWISPCKENLWEFSAVAWFFAKNIYEQYNVPVGLIATAWGGTPIETWMSREALADFPHKIADGDQYSNTLLCEQITTKTAADIQEWENRLRLADIGLKEEWQKSETAFSATQEITLPGNFSEAGLVEFCGVVWLYREFDVAANVVADFVAHDTKVWLGTITDADTVYINGVEVGNTTYRYPPRKYVIPAGTLREGKNSIVIRVTCVNGEGEGGGGSITRDKPFHIFSGDNCIELGGIWKYQVGAKTTQRPAEFFFQRHPMGSYNAMIAPVLQYPLKGVIWYQGESNDSSPSDYAALFPAMVHDWRKKAGAENLPFLFVQLPIWGEPADNNENASWAIIREAQAAALSLKATGMAVGLELGEWNDLHPINKKGIAERLFLAEERLLAKAENTAPGPLLRTIERRQDKLFLFFDNCGGGLRSSEPAFVSVIAGGIAHRLPAEIASVDSISVDVSSVTNPEKVLYAWANNPRDRQLFNSEGLPVIPFRAVV